MVTLIVVARAPDNVHEVYMFGVGVFERAEIKVWCDLDQSSACFKRHYGYSSIENT